MKIEFRDRIFLKCFDFLPFAKILVKITGKKSNTVKNSDKYSWKRIDHVKQPAVDSFKIA